MASKPLHIVVVPSTGRPEVEEWNNDNDDRTKKKKNNNKYKMRQQVSCAQMQGTDSGPSPGGALAGAESWLDNPTRLVSYYRARSHAPAPARSISHGKTAPRPRPSLLALNTSASLMASATLPRPPATCPPSISPFPFRNDSQKESPPLVRPRSAGGFQWPVRGGKDQRPSLFRPLLNPLGPALSSPRSSCSSTPTPLSLPQPQPQPLRLNLTHLPVQDRVLREPTCALLRRCLPHFAGTPQASTLPPCSALALMGPTRVFTLEARPAEPTEHNTLR